MNHISVIFLHVYVQRSVDPVPNLFLLKTLLLLLKIKYGIDILNGEITVITTEIPDIKQNL